MKKLHKIITRVELSHAFGEGRLAFDEKRRRGYNPYTSTKQELAMAWWHGWDTAQEESNSLGDKIPQSGYDSRADQS